MKYHLRGHSLCSTFPYVHTHTTETLKHFFFSGAHDADSWLYAGAWAKLLSCLSKHKPLAGDWLRSADCQSCYLFVFWVRRGGWQPESGITKQCPVQNTGTGVEGFPVSQDGSDEGRLMLAVTLQSFQASELFLWDLSRLKLGIAHGFVLISVRSE